MLIAMSGATTGKSGIYYEEHEAYLNQRVGKVVLRNNNVRYAFIAQWVNSNNFIEQLQSKLLAGAQPNISNSDIERFVLSIPCTEEQSLIADLLIDFDEAIAAAKKELELWKELKKGLLQQMFV